MLHFIIILHGAILYLTYICLNELFHINLQQLVIRANLISKALIARNHPLMAKISVLAVLGFNGKEKKADKFQKCLYDGLVSALGNYASEVDVAIATASTPFQAPRPTEKFGNAIIETLSSGCPLRILMQPKLKEFQAAFEETVALAVDAGPGSTIAIVYAGQVLHSTGEWILADSTFSGGQFRLWLDCEAATKWQPEIQMLTPPPTGVAPLQICLCTSSAGAKTAWSMPNQKTGADFVMLSRSRKVPVQLRVNAFWRVNGKLFEGQSPSPAYEGLLSLSQEMAEFHWLQQQEAGNPTDTDYELMPKTLKPSAPALYLMPSGPGGVQTQCAGLFMVEGVNVLMGSAFCDKQTPGWWNLTKNIDRLDAAIFPDWSAASIQSYQFLTHLSGAAATTFSVCPWLGAIMTPPGEENDSPLLLSPPSISNPFGSRQVSWTTPVGDRLPDPLRLFYKLGLGELVIQPLGGHVGVLLLWRPVAGKPVRLFIPAAHLPGGLEAMQGLCGILKALRKLPEVCSINGDVVKPSKSTMRPASGVTRTAPAVSKVSRPATAGLTNTKPRIPASATSANRATPSRSATKTTTAAVSHAKSTKPSTPMHANSTAASKPKPESKPKAPTPAIGKTAAKTTPIKRTATLPAKKTPATTNSTPKPIAKKPLMKTEDKLSAHAAHVELKTPKSGSAKPGTVLKFAKAGHPTNLPPRREAKEKTMMEELAEIPQDEIVEPLPSLKDSRKSELAGDSPSKIEVEPKHEEFDEDSLHDSDQPVSHKDDEMHELPSMTTQIIEKLAVEPQKENKGAEKTFMKADESHILELPSEALHAEINAFGIPQDSPVNDSLIVETYDIEEDKHQFTDHTSEHLYAGVDEFGTVQESTSVEVKESHIAEHPSKPLHADMDAFDVDQESPSMTSPSIEVEESHIAEHPSVPLHTDMNAFDVDHESPSMISPSVEVEESHIAEHPSEPLHADMNAFDVDHESPSMTSPSVEVKESHFDENPSEPLHAGIDELDVVQEFPSMTLPSFEIKESHIAEHPSEPLHADMNAFDVDHESPSMTSPSVEVKESHIAEHPSVPLHTDMNAFDVDHESPSMISPSVEVEESHIAEHPSVPLHTDMNAFDVNHESPSMISPSVEVEESHIAEHPSEPLHADMNAFDVDHESPSMTSPSVEVKESHFDENPSEPLHAGIDELDVVQEFPSMTLPSFEIKESHIAEHPSEPLHADMNAFDVDHESPSMTSPSVEVKESHVDENPSEPLHAGIDELDVVQEFPSMTLPSVEIKESHIAEHPSEPLHADMNAFDVDHESPSMTSPSVEVKESHVDENPSEPLHAGIDALDVVQEFPSMTLPSVEIKESHIAEHPSEPLHADMNAFDVDHESSSMTSPSVEVKESHFDEHLSEALHAGIYEFDLPQDSLAKASPVVEKYEIEEDKPTFAEHVLEPLHAGIDDLDVVQESPSMTSPSVEVKESHFAENPSEPLHADMNALDVEQDSSSMISPSVEVKESHFDEHPLEPLHADMNAFDVNQASPSMTSPSVEVKESHFVERPSELLHAEKNAFNEDQKSPKMTSPSVELEGSHIAEHPSETLNTGTGEFEIIQNAPAKASPLVEKYEMEEDKHHFAEHRKEPMFADGSNFDGNQESSAMHSSDFFYPFDAESKHLNIENFQSEPLHTDVNRYGMSHESPTMNSPDGDQYGIVSEEFQVAEHEAFRAETNPFHMHQESSVWTPSISEKHDLQNAEKRFESTHYEVDLLAVGQKHEEDIPQDAYAPLHAAVNPTFFENQTSPTSEAHRFEKDEDEDPIPKCNFTPLQADVDQFDLNQSSASMTSPGVKIHDEEDEDKFVHLHEAESLHASDTAFGNLSPDMGSPIIMKKPETDEEASMPQSYIFGSEIKSMQESEADDFVVHVVDSEPTCEEEEEDEEEAAAAAKGHEEIAQVTSTDNEFGESENSIEMENMPMTNMPPVHAEEFYELSSSRVPDLSSYTEGGVKHQPADSTTIEQSSSHIERPNVGFRDVERPGHFDPAIEGLTPTSEGSADSVLHQPHTSGETPEGYGFCQDVVSSSRDPAITSYTGSDVDNLSPFDVQIHGDANQPHTFPTIRMATEAEGYEVAPSTSPYQHPLLFNPASFAKPSDHSLDNAGTTDMPSYDDFNDYPKIPSNGFSNGNDHHSPTNGNEHIDAQGDHIQSEQHLLSPDEVTVLKSISNEALQEAGRETPDFDPVQAWGAPQHMPTPIPPKTTAHSRTLQNASRPSNATQSRHLTNPVRVIGAYNRLMSPAKAPDTLPAGSPVLLDVAWVPGYIIRVPFDQAVAFFTQFRARVYVLSGECLHPITGEALISGISKWTVEERATVGSMGALGLSGINIVPTDEPLEWVRWLRTSSRSAAMSETGEERLKAAGFTFHPSATLSDIRFSDTTGEISCPGTQITI